MPEKTNEPVPEDARFDPRAARPMAEMFDDVSGRYEFLNAVLSLGQDRAWRQALADAVPDDAHVVLDLCAGSGSSLGGLRRPGRVVLGMDVSLRMLELAQDAHGSGGWAPRLACADAFHLPLRDHSLDAVTIGFGIRNLRPRREALAEIARVLARSGTLAVLEAAAPRPGWFQPFHSFYVRRVIPLAGRLSSDPSAYEYLSRSILEFGSGTEFEADLAATGFALDDAQSFLLGATRLWVARSSVSSKVAKTPQPMHAARLGRTARGEMPTGPARGESEWRIWTTAQLVLSVGLVVALIIAGWDSAKLNSSRFLTPATARLLRVLIVVGTVGFALRSVVLFLRLLGPRPRR